MEGHVLIFSSLEEDKQMATKITPLRNTTGECLRVFVSTSEDSQLFIYIQGENEVQSPVASHQSLTKYDWGILFTQLPSGVNRIAVVGYSSIGRIILDDLEVGPCHHFTGKFDSNMTLLHVIVKSAVNIKYVKTNTMIK